MYDDVQLATVLNEARRIAIVGLSARFDSPSYGVGVYLIRRGYQVIPVNPQCTKIFGTSSYQTVSDIPGGVDMVVVFRHPRDVPDVARDVIEAAPKYLWLQSGIRHDTVAADVESRGVAVYQDICIKQTHKRLAQSNILKY
ncbi:MAG: CoA-binding protein [Gammaproteobacteria bacterium]|nr:CoA-binding protein [Gammaproteobacteria bacterium]